MITPKSLLAAFAWSICLLELFTNTLQVNTTLPNHHQKVFEKYCLECHDSDTEKGKVNLENLSFNIQTIAQAELWQKVLNSVNSGDMPPEDEPQLSGTEKTNFLDDLSQTMVRARKKLSDSGRTITLRRLNRREYRNTIESLLGVQVNVQDLPHDQGSATFDTVGSSLFMSSDQISTYLAIAKTALDNAFEKIEALKQQAPITFRRQVEDHANKKVGGTYNGYYKGGYTSAKAYLDSDRSKPAISFGNGIHDEQEAKFRVQQYDLWAKSYERYLQHPMSQTGSLLTISKVHSEDWITLPPEQIKDSLKTKHPVEEVPAGDYLIRFKAAYLPDSPPERRFVNFGAVQDTNYSFIKTFHITGNMSNPQICEIQIRLTQNSARKFQLEEKRNPMLDLDRFYAARHKTGVGPDPAIWIDWVEWEGPLKEQQHAEVLPRLLQQIDPSQTELEQAQTFFSNFSQEAFRGKTPNDVFIHKLVRIFEQERLQGTAFRESLKEGLSIILSTPGFIYLEEPNKNNQQRFLDDLELATRLSYFLTSSPPDLQLLKTAQSRQLLQPEILKREAERLITSNKIHEFISSFMHQWLDMERLDFFQFDAKQHKTFDEAVKQAARQEVYATFTYLLQNNLPLSDLLKSDYLVTNAVMASYYGIGGVQGDDYQMVKLPPSSPRGGLLGSAAIMAMGSNGRDSNPVERGAWVARHLLHSPPPPAPPNVPQLTRFDKQLLTTRERLTAHQEEPQCASCHRKIDPIGFGLENFNAVGLWRDKNHLEIKDVGKKDWDIDPAGQLYKGPAFKSYFELRELIFQRKESFARGFIEHLIEYALGRPHSILDTDLTENILRQLKDKNYATREVFNALILSDEFRKK